jgi:hypothetical protein
MGEAQPPIAGFVGEFRPSAPTGDPYLPGTQGSRAASDASCNPYASPRSTTEFKRLAFRAYTDVPWQRRSWVNTLFAFVGLTIFPPLVWWTCFNLITGDVYYNAEQDGRLITWSRPNKLVAVILLLFHAAMIVNIGTYIMVQGRFWIL